MTRIKQLCGIEGDGYDALIEGFVEMFRIPLGKIIKEEFYNNIQTRPIIDLGIDEIIAGNVINAIEKTKDHSQISISSFSFKEEEIQGDSLIKAGFEIIAPFRKDFTDTNFLSSTPEDDMIFK